MNKRFLPPLLLSLLAGCAGSPRYACGVPDGVGCKPVGEVYAASVSGTLAEGGVTQHDAPGNDERVVPGLGLTAPAETPVIATVKPGDPLLTRPRHLRVWIDRWEDQAGDLHDETYLYLRLDNGAWRLIR